MKQKMLRMFTGEWEELRNRADPRADDILIEISNDDIKNLIDVDDIKVAIKKGITESASNGLVYSHHIYDAISKIDIDKKINDVIFEVMDSEELKGHYSTIIKECFKSHFSEYMTNIIKQNDRY